MKTNHFCFEQLESRRCLTELAFNPGLVTKLEAGESPLIVELVDIDGDRDLDIVASVMRQFDTSANRLVWYENLNGEGTFGDETIIASETLVTSFELADLDADGDLDLVAVRRNSGSNERNNWWRGLVPRRWFSRVRLGE